MQEFIVAAEFIVLGFAGAIGHYLKKRYVDDTTKDSFYYYLTADKTSTKKAAWTIAGSCLILSYAHKTGYFIPLPELMGILTAGFTIDSTVNRSSEIKDVVNVVNEVNNFKK